MNRFSSKKPYSHGRMADGNDFHPDSRQGASALALLIFTAVFITASIAFVSIKFSPKDNSGEGLFSRTSAAVLKTFGNIFSAREEKPALEIDLKDNAPAGKKSAEKIYGTQTNENNSAIVYQNKNAEKISVPDPKTGNAIAISSPAEQKIQKQISECDILKSGVPNHQIIFSEVNWAGSKESPNDEWIEIKNNSGKDVLLGGWQILSADKNIKIFFADENKIPAGGFYLLERTDDNSAPGAAADAVYSGALSNAGAEIKIFSGDCSVSDEIISSGKWPAGDASLRRTMERSFLDFSWHTSASENGTPKKENTAAFSRKEPEIIPAQPNGTQNNGNSNPPPQNQPATSSANNVIPLSNNHILISEVMVGSDADSSYEFVEFYNPNEQAVNLTSWSVKKRSSSGSESTLLTKSYLDGIMVQPHRYFLMANASASIAVKPDVVWPKSYTLAYTQNAVTLYDANGAKIDEISWSEIPKNESYVRDSWNGNLFHISATPTPQNSISQ